MRKYRIKIVLIPFFIIVGAIGLVAFVLDPNILPNNALPYVVNTQLIIGVRGFVIAGILGVIMSSAAGFLNAGAVAFVNDIIRPITNDKVDKQKLLRLAKYSTALMGVGAVIFALAINNILDILLVSYTLWAPIILVPLIAVIFKLNCKPINFLLGGMTGLFAVVLWKWGLGDPYHINGVVIGVLANLFAFTGSYLLSQRFMKPASSRIN